ncbi:MAG: HEAT repeat domain-containing protein [Myxococcales bacterium]
MGTASLVILAMGASVAGLTALLWAVVRSDARAKRAAVKRWSEPARELGLRELDRPQGGHRLEGTVDGFAVEIEEQTSPDLIRVIVQSGGRIAETLQIERRGLWPQGKQEDVVTGAEDFDKQVRVRGPLDAALAALGAQTRADLVSFVGEGGKVAGSGLELALERHTDPEDFVTAVRGMLELAGHLAVPSLPKALLENATKDLSADVRHKCLDALSQFHPETREALWAYQATLRDLDPAMRLFAAERLPGDPEAREVLVKLVENRSLPEELRAMALERLVSGFSYGSAAPLVAWALSAESLELRCAAVRAVGKSKDESKVEALASLASQVAPLPLGEALAEALGAVGGAGAEDALFTLLRHESREVQAAAAKAFGECGTVRAVEPLLQSAKDGAVSSVARDAVRRIQARLGDADAGRLSVVDGAGADGALSLENPVPDDREKEGG